MEKKSLKSYGILLYRFQCSSAIVEFRRALHYDGNPLYRIIETPRSKSSKWSQVVYYFDFTDDATNKFKEVCDFWLR